MEEFLDSGCRQSSSAVDHLVVHYLVPKFCTSFDLPYKSYYSKLYQVSMSINFNLIGFDYLSKIQFSYFTIVFPTIQLNYFAFSYCPTSGHLFNGKRQQAVYAD